MTTTPITLITGGSRGLGAQMALTLARDGHDIVLTYREAAGAADAVVTQIHALGRCALALPLDVADAAGFPAFAERVKQGLADWGATRFGPRELSLFVLKGNDDARRLYERLGFRAAPYPDPALLPDAHYMIADRMRGG